MFFENQVCDGKCKKEEAAAVLAAMEYSTALIVTREK